MSAELLAAFAPLLDRIQRLVQSDPKLRAEVSAFGKALASWCEVAAEPKPAPAPTPITPLPPISPIAPLPVPPAPSYGRRFDDAPAQAVAITPPPFSTTYQDDHSGWMPQEPAVIAGRCRAKGDAAKVVAKRNSSSIDESQYLNCLAEVRAQAEKWPKCSLWMLDMVSLNRAAPVWDDLAGGYHAAAEAAEFLQVVTDPNSRSDPEQILAALNLAAEAQSLLFSAVMETGNARPDADQIQLYVTVRELAAARGTYIHRYLRREDRVDPRTWPDLRKRIAHAMEPFVVFQRKSGNVKKVLANLKFKLKKAAADGPDRYDEWPRVMELLDEAVAGGIAPNNSELREALLPIIESLPEDVMVPVGVTAIVRELDRHLASTPGNGKPHSEVPRVELDRVAGTLRDRTAVLIGGYLREADKREIERTFGLTELVWIQPACDLGEVERAIANPDTAAVFYAVRWAGHDFPDIRRLCAVYAKRLVRLPGGYSANAIAGQMLAQPDSSLMIA